MDDLADARESEAISRQNPTLYTYDTSFCFECIALCSVLWEMHVGECGSSWHTTTAVAMFPLLAVHPRSRDSKYSLLGPPALHILD